MRFDSGFWSKAAIEVLGRLDVRYTMACAQTTPPWSRPSPPSTPMPGSTSTTPPTARPRWPSAALQGSRLIVGPTRLLDVAQARLCPDWRDHASTLMATPPHVGHVLGRVPRASAEMVAAAVRAVFAQLDATHVRSQLDEVTRMLDGQFPDVATMLGDAAEDLLAFTGFPQAHWRKLWSTNPVRHEAPHDRVEMKGLHLLAVAAA